MAFDRENQKAVNRLVGSLRWSYRQMAVHRNNRKDFQRQYLGRKYSTAGATKSVPVNLIEQFVNVYLRDLVPASPSAFVTARNASLSDVRTKLELGLNHLAREIDLETTLRFCVYDALMMMAVCKIGINAGQGARDSDGFLHDTGMPFVDHVLFDDLILDYAAKAWETMEYVGDGSEELLEEVRDLYPKHADALNATDFVGQSEEGDTPGDPVDRNPEQTERLNDYVRVWQVWIPGDNQIVLIPADSRGFRNIVLDQFEWQGPEAGPYRQLGFSPLPGSVIPLSPVSTLYEAVKLHDALFRKTARQAEHQKTVLMARRGSEKDARKLITAEDMEVITGDDPNMVKDFRFNGADPQTLQMAQMMRQLVSEAGGNTQLLGGLSPQSETLGQDKLLSAAASKRMASMQASVLKFTKQIFQDLAWWLHTDPLITLPLVTRIPGTDRQLTVNFTPEDREGDFLDYNIDVNPYSMQSRSPQEEFELLISVFQNFILPFEQQLAAQGMTVNFPAMIKRIAELTNLKSMDEVLMYTGASAQAPPTIGSPPRAQNKPQQRQDGQGGSQRQFQDMGSMMNMLMGSAQQPQAGAA